TLINRLRKLAIYGQPQLSLEHQGRAKRYIVRGVESGGANEEVGYYVTFAGESGDALAWLQTLDSLTVTRGGASTVLAQRVYCSTWTTLRNWRNFSERQLKAGLRWQSSSTESWCASAGIEVHPASKNRGTKSLTL